MDGEQQERARRKELEFRTRHARRLETDPDYKRRFVLKCATGGFGRNGKPKITLAKMSWDK